MKNWAEFDDDFNFRKAYEEHHGAGTWELLMDEWDDCVEGMTQEVWGGVE